MSLPPILIESMQRALDNGTFFSNNSLFGHFLPRPKFPSARRAVGNGSRGGLSHLLSAKLGPLVDGFQPCRDDTRPNGEADDLSTLFDGCATPDRVQDVCKTPQNLEGVREFTGDCAYHLEHSFSFSPSVGFKKHKKIVLTAEQAKDVSYSCHY